MWRMHSGRDCEYEKFGGSCCTGLRAREIRGKRGSYWVLHNAPVPGRIPCLNCIPPAQF